MTRRKVLRTRLSLSTVTVARSAMGCVVSPSCVAGSTTRRYSESSAGVGATEGTLMPCVIPGDAVANSNATTADANRCVRPTRFAHAMTICVPYDAGHATHITLQLLAVAPCAAAQDERSRARSPNLTRTLTAPPIWCEGLRGAPVIRLSAPLSRRQVWTR